MGASQTGRLLRRLGDGGLGYQQVSMSNHGRPRGKPEKAQTRGPQGCLVGRHEPLRGGQEELGSIPGVWFLFPFSWGNSPAGETLLIALPGSRFLRRQRQALRTTSSPAQNKGIRRRDRRREEEAWVSEGKSPPSAVLPAGRNPQAGDPTAWEAGE